METDALTGCSPSEVDQQSSSAARFASSEDSAEEADESRQAVRGPNREVDLLGMAAIVGELREFGEEIEKHWPALDTANRMAIRSVVSRLSGVASERAERAAGPGNGSPANAMRDGWMFVASICLAGLWLVVFSLGFAVPAAPHLVALDTAHEASLSILAAVGNVLLVIICSTSTNPGILACIAALLGGLARWIHVDGSSPNAADGNGPLMRVFVAPMLRGFFMYLALLAGLLLLTTQAITNATQDQYVQLAGTVSVFAFMIGYDPNVFRKLMGKVNGWAVQREQEDPANPQAAQARRPSGAGAPADGDIAVRG